MLSDSGAGRWLVQSYRSARLRQAVVHRAEESLKVYELTMPDLLIVDLMMEEIDAGANFCKNSVPPGMLRRSTC